MSKKPEKLVYKKRGANAQIIIDGEKLGKKITIEQGKELKEYVEAYNNSIEKGHTERTLKKWLNKINAIMLSNTKRTEKEKAATKAKVKAATKRAQKIEKKASAKPKPTTTPKTQSSTQTRRGTREW